MHADGGRALASERRFRLRRGWTEPDSSAGVDLAGLECGGGLSRTRVRGWTEPDSSAGVDLAGLESGARSGGGLSRTRVRGWTEPDSSAGVD